MRAKPTPPVERVCEWCGVTFITTNGRIRQGAGRFHSRDCWRAWLNGRWTPEQLADRFWARVDRRNPDECWPWLGGRIGADGYGSCYWDRKTVLTHRLAYFLGHGEWPQPQANHRCNNPRCCNPTHIYAGTPKQNREDWLATGKKRGPGPQGERNPTSRLNDVRVRLIRRLLSDGWSRRDVARLTDVSRHTITDIAVGRTWRHLI